MLLCATLINRTAILNLENDDLADLKTRRPEFLQLK
jgi:hypothetical protein